jgi:hypothetical protein
MGLFTKQRWKYYSKEEKSKWSMRGLLKGVLILRLIFSERCWPTSKMRCPAGGVRCTAVSPGSCGLRPSILEIEANWHCAALKSRGDAQFRYHSAYTVPIIVCL